MKRTNDARDSRRPLFSTLDDALAMCTSTGRASLQKWNAALAKVESDGDLTQVKHVFDAMVSRGVVPNEASWFLLMRAAASAEDYAMVKATFFDMLKQHVRPHARDYALVMDLAARSGDAKFAWDMLADMRGSGEAPNEKVLCALLGACSGRVDHLRQALDVVVRFAPVVETPELGDALVGLRLHAPDGVVSANDIGRPSAEGRFANGVQLKKVHLRPQDARRLQDNLVQLMQRGRQREEFSAFKLWVDRRAPYAYVLDAANIAYGGGGKNSTFRWKRVESALAQLPKDASRLVIVHEKWLTLERGTMDGIERLRRSSSAYVVPSNNNDDWYWLYAAMASGEGVKFVSNDECRDHAYASLEPALLTAWRDAHRVKYVVSPRDPLSVVLDKSAMFTARSQIPKEHHWLFPQKRSEQWIHVAFEAPPLVDDKASSADCDDNNGISGGPAGREAEDGPPLTVEA